MVRRVNLTLQRIWLSLHQCCYEPYEKTRYAHTQNRETKCAMNQIRNYPYEDGCDNFNEFLHHPHPYISCITNFKVYIILHIPIHTDTYHIIHAVTPQLKHTTRNKRNFGIFTSIRMFWIRGLRHLNSKYDISSFAYQLPWNKRM